MEERSMTKPDHRRRVAALIPLIYEIARSVCARRRVVPDEREDFESFLFETFLDEESRVLSQFRGDGSLEMYLRVVIGRLLLDYRNRKWGKWRPSARAKQLGSLAIELERLIEREGFSRWEAVRHLRTNAGVARSELELLDLAEELPRRARRRFEGEEVLATLACSGGQMERVNGRTRNEAIHRVRTTLGQALCELRPDVRHLLAARFADGLSVAEIARRSGEDQRKLYRRLERALRELRRRLQGLGVDHALVRSALGAT
jgi:RNA polymerase sigma factor (sigma-70 family)